MEQPTGSALNPFGNDEDEQELKREEEGEEGQKSTTVFENVSVSHCPPVAEVKHHWTALGKIINDTQLLTDPFLLEEIRDHLSSIEKLVSRERRPSSKGRTGDCLAVVLSENMIENVYMFGIRQKVHGRDIRIMLLKFFTEVFAHSRQDILIHQQFLRPLNRLLRACEGSEDGEISTALVPLLHQICILIQENHSLLDLFFVEGKAHHPPKFFIFTQLVPHMHDTTEIGNRSRDALLLCLSLADRLPHTTLSQFIAIDCNFCQVLATGLSALYSDLPTTCSYSVDEWQSPLPVIEACVPELSRFYQALEFCNSVLQMSPKVICDRIVVLTREGFLQQVVGPALFQSSEEAVTMAMAYLTLFLTHISNISLMREFLKFLIEGKYDGRSIINVILYSISSNSVKTCSVALELVYVLVDLNCEDVMLGLVFQYLLPGNHIMQNQLAMLARPDIYGQAAKRFLQLLPSSCITAEKMFLESIRPHSNATPSHSYPGTPNRSTSPPPPPLLTSSPLHSAQLERPKPTHLAVPSKTNGVSVSTNPFDVPVPFAPRSRSGSNGSSSGSLVSISSSISGGQPLNNHPQTMLTSSSTVGMLQFEYIPPPLSYMHNLIAAKEAIESCWVRCRSWSNMYDNCLIESSGDCEKSEVTKSREMEDVNVTDDSSKPEDEEKSLAKLSTFRTRSVTVSSTYRLPLARTRDSNDVMGGTDVRNQKREDHQLQGGSRNVSQALQNLKRLSRKSEDSRFEETTGLLLKVLMDKLSEILCLPPVVNVLLTKVVSRLAHYPQPLLRSLLLNHQLVLRPGVPNLSYVLQGVKITIDRYARSQEDFEKRLGRARKTMIYRAHVRNAQLEESVASQIVARLTKQSSVVSQLGDTPGESTTSSENHNRKQSSDSMEEPIPRPRSHTEVQRTRPIQRTRRTKAKKVSTHTLFAIVIFDEFLRELASLAHEHSCLNLATPHVRTGS